jgi:hypothetical protein
MTGGRMWQIGRDAHRQGEPYRLFKRWWLAEDIHK